MKAEPVAKCAIALDSKNELNGEAAIKVRARLAPDRVSHYRGNTNAALDFADLGGV